MKNWRMMAGWMAAAALLSTTEASAQSADGEPAADQNMLIGQLYDYIQKNKAEFVAKSGSKVTSRPDGYEFEFEGPNDRWTVIFQLVEGTRIIHVASVLHRNIPGIRRVEAAQLFNSYNRRIGVGSWDINVDSGEFRFRTTIDLGSDGNLTEEMLNDLVKWNMMVVSAFSGGLNQLVFRSQPAADVLAQLQRSNPGIFPELGKPVKPKPVKPGPKVKPDPYNPEPECDPSYQDCDQTDYRPKAGFRPDISAGVGYKFMSNTRADDPSYGTRTDNGTGVWATVGFRLSGTFGWTAAAFGSFDYSLNNRSTLGAMGGAGTYVGVNTRYVGFHVGPEISFSGYGNETYSAIYLPYSLGVGAKARVDVNPLPFLSVFGAFQPRWHTNAARQAKIGPFHEAEITAGVSFRQRIRIEVGFLQQLNVAGSPRGGYVKAGF